MATAVGQGEAVYYEYSNPVYNSISKGRTPGHITLVKDAPITLIPLKDIIKAQGVDFLNIDAEGVDLEVLKTHDWNIYPSIIAIEGDEASDFLGEKGYTLVAMTGPTRIWQHKV